MGMCKACGEVYGALDMQGQYCRKCYEQNKEEIVQSEQTSQKEVKHVQVKKVQVETNDTASMVLGLMGAFIMIVGIFAPVVSVPILGEVNYFNHGKGDGVIIAILGIVSIVLVLIRQYVWLAASGGVSLLVLGYTAISMNKYVDSLKTEVSISKTHEAFQGVANSLIDQVTFEWGFALLFVASLMLFISAFFKGQQ